MPTYATAKCLSPLHPYTSRELQKTYMLLSILIHCYAFITLCTPMHIPPYTSLCVIMQHTAHTALCVDCTIPCYCCLCLLLHILQYACICTMTSMRALSRFMLFIACAHICCSYACTSIYRYIRKMYFLYSNMHNHAGVPSVFSSSCVLIQQGH